jgi:serine/threonine protein kinase
MQRDLYFIGKQVVFIGRDPPRCGSAKNMVSGCIPSHSGVDSVAILTVHTPSANDKREVEILRHLQGQPWAVHQRDSFEFAQTMVMVQDLCRGGDLKARIAQHTWTEGEIVFVVYQILHMLNELHKMDIVHRDVKLANILLEDREGVPILKLADFAYACLRGVPPAEMEAVGTPYNLAPEIAAFYDKQGNLQRTIRDIKDQLTGEAATDDPLLQEMLEKEEQLRTLTREFAPVGSDFAVDCFSVAYVIAELVKNATLMTHLRHNVQSEARALQLRAFIHKRSLIDAPPPLGAHSHPVAHLAIPLMHPDPQKRKGISQVLQDPLLIKTLGGSSSLRIAIEQGRWDLETLFKGIFGRTCADECGQYVQRLQAEFDQAAAQIYRARLKT